MKKFVLMSSLCMLVLLGTTTRAMAEDLKDPPWVDQTGWVLGDPSDPRWDPGLGSMTSQAWNFDLSEPDPTSNEYGPVSIEIVNGEIIYEYVDGTGAVVPVLGPNGNPTGAVQIGTGDGTGGQIRITITNDPQERPLKMIFTQITSDKAPSGVSTSPAGTPVPGAGTPGPTGWGVPPNAPAPSGRWWYTYFGLYQIIPNPDSETVIIDFPDGTYVEEIVIDTICTVPEPATMSFLALGGLAVLRRRRK